jgi:hypothetical protein
MSTDNKSGDTKDTIVPAKIIDKKADVIDKNAVVNSESTITGDVSNIFATVFSPSNIILVVWFLAAYLITYIVIGIFSSGDSGPSLVIRIIDIFVILLVFGYISFYYYNIPSEERDNTIKNMGESTYKLLNDTTTLLYSGVFLFLYYIFVTVLLIPTTGAAAPISLTLLSTIAWILFVITAIVVFCKEVLGIYILNHESLLFLWQGKSTKPSSDDKSETSDGKKTESKLATEKDEVFNVSNNLYTYDDAKAVCTAYGSRLATYNEIEDAYNKGAEWCNYGWSDGQMAFFPTQKTTWTELQKNPKAKNNCGRPGVNGGYMENPYIKFGVNCYGKKPKPSDRDLQSMEANKNIIFPKTEEDNVMDRKVQFWKENADKLLHLNSFNRNKWSEN